MRILLVEDERKVASFIARALREKSYAVDVAATGEQGLDLAATEPYDAILLDIRLPGVSGIEVCRQLRQGGMETPILMLTARGLVEQRVEGLNAGADDYLTKPFALAELEARVQALIRRGFGKTAATLRCADLELDRHRRRAKRGESGVPLTSREFALLEFLMLRSPDPVTRSEIVEHVWDCHFDSETNLVEVYINRLRQKIDQDHSPKLIRTVRGLGYSLRSEE
ncbi:MAG: response regulator transcription factor [Acidobacteria bacterium]|nr:response regulator transcription factor [Acidobacteriota bacterium]